MAQVIFVKDGVDCVSFYNMSNTTQEKVIKLIHEGSIRRQYAKAFRDEIKDLANVDDNTLGYVLEELSKKKFYRKISNIRFLSDKERINIKFGR